MIHSLFFLVTQCSAEPQTTVGGCAVLGGGLSCAGASVRERLYAAEGLRVLALSCSVIHRVHLDASVGCCRCLHYYRVTPALCTVRQGLGNRLRPQGMMVLNDDDDDDDDDKNVIHRYVPYF